MKIICKILSSDGITTKYLQATSDRVLVETAYINRTEKHIICFSSQVGCVIGCVFCASGIASRYRRSLTSGELVEQCLNVVGEISFDVDPKPLLFSCMGEGEPFLNFDACVDALSRLARVSLPVKTFLAVSTSGIKPELIRCLGHIEFPVPLKLQVSLHGPTDEVRWEIVPTARPLNEIVKAVRAYVAQCNRPVDWNYVMCAGVNDGPEHAAALAHLLGSGWHVKLNCLNPITNRSFRPSPPWRVEKFRRVLEASGISTEYYITDGSDVAAACGQLSYRFNSDGLTPR